MYKLADVVSLFQHYCMLFSIPFADLNLVSMYGIGFILDVLVFIGN